MLPARTNAIVLSASLFSLPVGGGYTLCNSPEHYFYNKG